MGLAEDLKALQQLREKGELTESAYSAARDAAIGAQTAPPTASRRLGRFVGFRVKLLLAILLGLLTLVWYNAGTKNTTQAIATAIHAPITVIDEVQNLSANSWKAVTLNLPYPGTVSVNLEVVQGNPVDVILTTPDQLEAMKKDDWGSVKVYGNFNATKTQKYRRTGQLGQGSYYLVMRDTSLGILSASATDISIKAELNP